MPDPSNPPLPPDVPAPPPLPAGSVSEADPSVSSVGVSVSKGRNLADVLQEFSQQQKMMKEELQKIIVGQEEVIEQLFAAIFTRGHCLLEGVPGLAKTLMVSTLSRILDVDFKRIQFTPDLMPSDITGTNVLDEDENGRQISVLWKARSLRTYFSRTRSTERRRRRSLRCFRRCRNGK